MRMKFAVTLLCLAAFPAAAESLLSGTVTSASGERMGGVTVSAKADGATITTSVFTDESGAYVMPPLGSGHYRVWAQAASFDTARGSVALDGNARQDFVMKPAQGDFVRQLTGDQIIAALPEATPEDRTLKRIFRNNCVGCHTPEYTLQQRFDEAGWTAVLELMKRINVFGVYQGPNGAVNEIIDHNEKALAAYLARARGPGKSSMHVKLRPRPAGEAARVVFKEYDVPIDPALGLSNKYLLNDGSDWMQGTPSALEGSKFVHDAWPDLDGNLWFTNNTPSHDVSIGRIDAATGAVKFIKVEGPKGMAANAHGMTRDQKGFIWFNIGTVAGHAGLGRLDPRTEHIDVYVPPAGISGVGGAPTVDVDGKGNIWVSAADGALRFDPVREEYTEFKSATQKTAQGTGLTYGVAADADGNGWWAQMAIDIVGHSDVASGKALEIKVPPLAAERARLPAAERAFYDQVTGLDFGNPLPWGEGPRRLGADKNGHVVWVCDYWGGSLFRIDTRTLKTSFVKLPNPETQHPYHATIDSHHDVWVNLMNADQVMRYDPKTGKWTAFDFPGHGAETRYVALLEHDGKLEVVVPYYRTQKVAVMTFRSEGEVQALKNEARKSAAVRAPAQLGQR